MKTIDLLFATGQTMADITPMDCSVIFTTDSLKNIERVPQTIREAQQENPSSATEAAPQAQGSFRYHYRTNTRTY